jgi:hypothetical protein
MYRNEISYAIQGVDGKNRTISIDCRRSIYRSEPISRESARRIIVRETGDDTVSVSRVEPMKIER